MRYIAQTYIEVLWSEMINLCKNIEHYFYINVINSSQNLWVLSTFLLFSSIILQQRRREFFEGSLVNLGVELEATQSVSDLITQRFFL